MNSIYISQWKMLSRLYTGTQKKKKLLLTEQKDGELLDLL